MTEERFPAPGVAGEPAPSDPPAAQPSAPTPPAFGSPTPPPAPPPPPGPPPPPTPAWQAPTPPGGPTPPSGPPPSGPTPGGPPPSGPPPGGSPPPPPGPGAPEPPPLTAFAWRRGLVRPTQGRILAGVCGAFGRATNTDPILWRVVIAVLTIFAGIGALIYLVAWLALPADGDTASPIEALAGRGRSRTSTPLTIAGTVIVIFALAAYVSEPFRATPLLAAFLLGGVLLLLLRDQQRGRVRAGGPAEAGYVAPVPPAYAMSAAPTAPVPPFAPPPFAPHGPFVTPPTPPPPPPPPRPIPALPPKPPKPKSRLGGLVFSFILVALGGLAALNLAGVHVPPSAFLAAALGLAGIGLIIAAWIGRARGLIALGIILTLVLSGGLLAGWDTGWRGDWWRQSGSTTWVPASVDSIEREYRLGAGEARLDLSNVDFAGSDTRTITVKVDVGSLTIVLPPDVDTTITAKVDVGDATVFDQQWDGLGQSPRTITDLGNDGVGGGKVNINATVELGELKVTR